MPDELVEVEGQQLKGQAQVVAEQEEILPKNEMGVGVGVGGEELMKQRQPRPKGQPPLPRTLFSSHNFVPDRPWALSPSQWDQQRPP